MHLLRHAESEERPQGQSIPTLLQCGQSCREVIHVSKRYAYVLMISGVTHTYFTLEDP